MERRQTLEDSFQLSDKQQALLELLYDEECSVITRFLAKRLLRTNTYARQFYSSLESSSSSLLERNAIVESTVFANTMTHNSELWNLIEGRIESEERASLFLGERRLGEKESQGILERFFESWIPVSGRGLATGAVACTALVIVGYTQFHGFFPGVFPPVESSNPTMTAHVAASEKNEPLRIQPSAVPVPVELVSSHIQPTRQMRERGMPLSAETFDRYAFDDLFSSTPQRIQAQPRIRTQQVANRNFSRNTVGNAVEVDWMKSDGRLHILNDPQASAPIIFVRKKTPHYRIGGGIIISPNSIPAATFANR